MSDLRHRLRDIEGFVPPDLWQDIADRRPTGPSREPGPVRRVLVAVVALALAIAALALVVRAFRSSGSVPSHPRPLVSNGPLWALGGGGEAGALIYAVDPATGAKTPLWSDGRNSDFPNFVVAPAIVSGDYAFSPDGSRVAFSNYVKEGPQDCCNEIFEMNSDGTGLSQVTHDQAYASFPSWSPDGTEIVFTSYRGDGYVPGCDGSTLCPGNLYAIGADGTGERQLTDDPADESMPSWSPDGTTIAFRRARGGSGDGLFVMNADGSGVVEHAFPPRGLILDPEWSPDGSRILFLFAGPQERFGVWVQSADGSEYPHHLIDTNADTTFGRPVWSPDGAEIAFAKVVDGEPQLWVMRADGADPHLVAELPSYGISPLAWRPVQAGTSTPEPKAAA
jgi:dipeptidyl aminopeptidase/acylaminoacyl peptidase